MKILFFGDIFGRPGREALKKVLPELRSEFSPDLVLANAENAAHGHGLTEKSIGELKEAGIDFMTSGDHAFTLSESSDVLENEKLSVLRPLNWPGEAPGEGHKIIQVGARRLMLVNLMGRVFIRQDFDDPFPKISQLLDDYSLKGKEQGSEAVDAIIVDFHAEATSEKAALAWYLDGKVSCVLGTHTHVATADERILPAGTAFISDLGMVGPKDSVLGVNKEMIIKRFLTQRALKMEVAQGPVIINGVFVETDDSTGLAKKIERISKVVDLE